MKQTPRHRPLPLRDTGWHIQGISIEDMPQGEGEAPLIAVLAAILLESCVQAAPEVLRIPTPIYHAEAA